MKVGTSSFDLTGPSTYGSCDPYNSEALALAPKACFFGNLHGSKTIVLVGDSNVGNWVPALSIGLAKTAYRLAVQYAGSTKQLQLLVASYLL